MALSLTSNANQWTISGDDRSRHDQQFYSLQPQQGMVTGTQARQFFMKSGLPSQTLATIWQLADLNQDGKLDRKEFSIAMFLIQKKLQGFTLPTVLPDSLKADPQPSLGSFGPNSSPMAASLPSAMPLSQPQALQLGAMPGSTGSMNMQPYMGTGLLVSGISAPVAASVTLPQHTFQNNQQSLTDWTMPQAARLKYSQKFNSVDTQRQGFLSGLQARNVLSHESHLPANVLAQVWTLSDVDKDGRLVVDEFCIAMHLCDMVNQGFSLPKTTPNELLPSLKGDASLAFSFEDKRRQNYEKGQAELERRRAILQEQEKREREERDRKEQVERDRIERERLEQERKRQIEIEKFAAKQREDALKREEEHRHMLEQREAARRELERQRQLEHERQRVIELTAVRQKHQETVCHLKQQSKNLAFQLQALQEKAQELDSQIFKARSVIVETTSEIEKMKVKRDEQLRELDALKREQMQAQQRMTRITAERAQLQYQQINGSQHVNVESNLQKISFEQNQHQLNIDRLKIALEQVEHEIQENEVAGHEKEKRLNESREQMNHLFEQNQRLREQVQDRQRQVRELLQRTHPQLAAKLSKQASLHKQISLTSPIRQDAFGGTPDWVPQRQPSMERVPSITSGEFTRQTSLESRITKINGAASRTARYRALYAFCARSEDELTFQPGDIITVFLDHVAEPGWLAGQFGSKVGWFPDSYTEPVDKVVENAVVLESENQPTQNDVGLVHRTQLDGIAEDEETLSTSGAFADQPQRVSANYSDEFPLVAQALFPWKAKKEGELTFQKGDMIRILQRDEMWWKGELQDTSVQGIFPKSYVKLVSGGGRRNDPSELPTTQINAANSVVVDRPQVEGISRDEIAHPSQLMSEFYTAVYAFVAAEPGDLSFQAGERIEVIRKDGDWWTGRIDGREGIFPHNYVQEVQVLLAPSEPAKVNEEVNISQQSVDSRQSVDLGGGEMFEVIAPFAGTAANQLTLSLGDIISVRAKSPTGWWEGTVSGRRGWFPAAYAKPVKPSDSKAVTDEQEMGDKVNKVGQVVVSLYVYEPQRDDELQLAPGDQITLTDLSDDAWWRGKKSDGSEGLFPSNYVQSSQDADSSLAFLRKQSTLSILQARELLETEINFLEDLKMVQRIFFRPLATQLNSDEVDVLKIGWPILEKTSKHFIKGLKSNQGSEADVILRQIDALRTAFLPSCRQLPAALDLLDRRLADRGAFAKLHRQCCASVEARGLPLNHFLLLPLTRVTKYHLMVQEMHRKADSFDEHSKQKLQLAYEALKQLCAEADQALSHLDSLRMLHWCQQRVKVPVGFPFVFLSSTRSQGPRRYILGGLLQKTKSQRLLMAFLFNDILLLASPQKSVDHPESFRLSHSSDLQLSMYRLPLLLSNLRICDVRADDAQWVLEWNKGLEQGSVSVALKALDTNSGRLWINKLQKAIEEASKVDGQDLGVSSEGRLSWPDAVGRLLVEVCTLSTFKLPTELKSCPIYCQLEFGSQVQKCPIAFNIPSGGATAAAAVQKVPMCSTQLMITAECISAGAALNLSIRCEQPYSPDQVLSEGVCNSIDALLNQPTVKAPSTVQIQMIHNTPDCTESNGSAVLKLFAQMF